MVTPCCRNRAIACRKNRCPFIWFSRATVATVKSRPGGRSDGVNWAQSTPIQTTGFGVSGLTSAICCAKGRVTAATKLARAILAAWSVP